MKPVQSLKLLNEVNHARQFGLVYRSIERRISADQRWINPTNSSDLSAVVMDPNNRLIMEPGQYHATAVKRSSRGKEGFESPMIIMGTPYGVVCMHYLTESKFNVSEAFSCLASLNPVGIHTTKHLIDATERFIFRKIAVMASLPGYKFVKAKREESLLTFLKFWMLTESFFADLNEQVEFDKKANIEITDGLPKPNFELKRTVKPERRENKRPVEAGKDRRHQDRRNKPATPRSANYTPLTVHSQRPPKKDNNNSAA